MRRFDLAWIGRRLEDGDRVLPEIVAAEGACGTAVDESSAERAFTSVQAAGGKIRPLKIKI
jgi:hypothetical protein